MGFIRATRANQSGHVLELNDPTLLLLREDVGENYDSVTRTAAAAVGAASCSLALYDADARHLIARRPRYASPGQAVPQFRFPIAAAPASAHVVDTGQPYVSNDPASDPLYHPSVRDQGLKSILTVPVKRGSRVLGLLYALNKPGGFDAEDVRTLEALAGAAAVTLHNVQLYSNERERRILNESLREVSRALVGTPGEEEALTTVLDEMWRVLRYEAASALVLEDEQVRVAASRGGDSGFSVRLAELEPLPAALSRSQAEVLVAVAPLLAKIGIGSPRCSALVAPLRAHQGPLGALVVVFEGEHVQQERDRRLVEAFAEHAALFLEAGAALRRERRGRAQATALARIVRVAAARHEPHSLLEAVAPDLLAASGADRCIVLRRSDPDTLSRVADVGSEADEHEAVDALSLPLVQPELAELVKGQALLCTDEAQVPKPLAVYPSVGSAVVIPLMVRDELLGAVALYWLRRDSRREARAEPADVAWLKDVIQQVALGVENARLFTALSELASTDELTGLANRRRFREAIRLEMERARRSGVPVSLVIADIDLLKSINDSYGHAAGDAAIRHVADALRQGRRETDVVARLGGEEFALLLPGTERKGAIAAAERIRAELAASNLAGLGAVTVSVGVATSPEDSLIEEELIRIGDARLYAAKAAGRNRVCDRTPEETAAAAGSTATTR